MKKCLLFAMFDEAAHTIKEHQFKLIQKQPYEVYENDQFFLLISQIGLVNAGSALTWVDSNYEISEYINFGMVGCNSNVLNIKDILNIKNVYLGNVDATGFGYKMGQVPQMPAFYTLKGIKNEYNTANICSSDVFINGFDKYNSIVKPIEPNIELFDMELAGFAQAAFRLKKEINAIKIVSDILGSKSNEKQFLEVKEFSSNKISEIIKTLN
ncbi:hypothetical protein [Spiroplasma endosymbiont of Crioceris asparagi]|uniref:5'-methylthioadenosine/S-adenosylhomocysteine nucleosidase family protein n=1 Tax=Spiroplasma endosymbiont of Crioceris asparagi TaxID=3066286 RepID=UPI0030CCD0A5